MKFTRRSVLFNMFVLFALLITIFLPFILYPEGDKIKIGHFDLPWYSQALNSSIPFMTAYYYNFIQLMLVIFMASNDLRRDKLNAMLALDARPQFNADMIVGRFLGRLTIFCIVSVVVFAVAICYNAVFFPRVFNPLFYLFYWGTLVFPALVYFMGLSILVTRLFYSQGASIFVLLLLGGGATVYGTGFMCDVFDPLARRVPNLFSDFTGHAGLFPYLLHRMIYLFAGLFLLILSIQFFRRVPNNSHLIRNNLALASVPLFGIMVLVALYWFYFNGLEQSGSKYRQIYLEHENLAKAKVLEHDIRFCESMGGGFAAESKMILVNHSMEDISLLLYLNPGLKVNKIEINNTPLGFKRLGQVILVDKRIASGDTCHLVMDYDGFIDKTVCYSDIPFFRRNPFGQNSQGIYCPGNEPVFCTENYKLLTPECLWYPVCQPPTCFSVSRKSDFTRYGLTVIHDERHVAISQGHVSSERASETVFHHDHALQGISLCLGDYNKKSIVVDSVLMELYCFPGHEYLLPELPGDMNTLQEVLFDVKFQRIEEREYILSRDGKGWTEWDKRKVGAPNLRYPYSWLRLVETPVNFGCHVKNDQIDGERVQSGLVFLSEKLCTQREVPSKAWNFQDTRGDDKLLYQSRLSRFVDSNLVVGRYNIKPLLRKPCYHVYSSCYPMIDDVLSLVLYRDFSSGTDYLAEYNIIRYMSCHSLMDALNDPDLSPGDLFLILKRKSQELRAIIYSRVPKKEFQDFYFRFFSNHRFTDIDFQAFDDEFNQYFHFPLDEILKKWYNQNRLPVFKTNGKCYMAYSPENVQDNKEKELYYVYEVFNTSDEDGVVMLSSGGCHLIPKHSCKSIVAKEKLSLASHRSSWIEGELNLLISFGVEMPMSQNLPAIKSYLYREECLQVADLETGVFDSDSLVFDSDSLEILVDNMDPRCKVIQSKSWLQVLLDKMNVSVLKVHKDKKKEWQIDIDQNYHGFPIQSAYCKPNGEGNNSVEWTVHVPENGVYEIFVHSKNRGRDSFKDYDKTQYFSILTGKDEHDIAIDVNDQNEGWVSLGKYKIEKEEIKIVQYDKQSLSIEMYFKSRDYVVADAVKLRKVL